MISLPPLRRASLRAFAVSLWLCLGSLVAVIAGARGGLGWALLGPVATSWLPIVGWLKPDVFERSYRLWNRLAKAFARRAQRFVLLVCYRTVFCVIRRPNARLVLDRPGDGASGWVRGTTLELNSYGSQDEVPLPADVRWVRLLTSWALRRGEPWLLPTLPLLILVSALDTNRESAPTANIYTLY